MADLLADGLSFLTKQLRQFASQTVTYVRGDESFEVQATFGKKLLKFEHSAGGIRMEWTDMDFLIPKSDMVFDLDDTQTPLRGDLIYVTIDDTVEVFQAFPYGGSEPVWHWADPHQSMFRIHCKHVETEGEYY